MDKGLTALDEGSIGYFWISTSGEVPEMDQSAAERGFARRDEGWARVSTLDERSLNQRAFSFSESSEAPEAVVGMMPDFAGVFLEHLQPSSSQVFGGQGASTNGYRARTVIGGVSLRRLMSCRPIGIEAHFEGIDRWAGFSATKEEYRFHPDGQRLQSWNVTLEGDPDHEFSTRLSGGRSLEVGPHWQASGPTHHRDLAASIAVGCVTRRPADTWHVLEPVLRVQDLLNFVFDGFVEASTGSGTFKMRADEEDRSAPWMWSGALMVPAPSVSTAERSGWPRLSLEVIGGIEGLRRWVALGSRHQRAVRVLTTPYRYGRATAAARLIEAARGIEYWVKVHRPAQWAAGRLYATQLAQHVGRSFGEWVGDPDVWASRFWNAYNQLKHETTYSPDDPELSDLASSGRYLLAAAIFDQIGRSKRPGQMLLNHADLNWLGHRLQSADRHP